MFWIYCLLLPLPFRHRISCMSELRKEKTQTAQASGATVNIFHLLCLLKAKTKGKTSRSSNRGKGRWRQRGEMAGAAGNTWPQHHPPAGWSLSPFHRAPNGKRLFSCCFIKHRAVLFIAVSPNGCTIPAEAFPTAADQTEKGQRINSHGVQWILFFVRCWVNLNSKYARFTSDDVSLCLCGSYFHHVH